MINKQEIIVTLKQRNYKLTRQRRVILDIIVNNQSHLSPADVYQKAIKRYPRIGLVTVYRTLELLANLGFICEMHADNSCRSYMVRRSSGHHHHLLCSDCQKVIDFTDCDCKQMEERIAHQMHFKIDSHLIEFVGRCSDCLRRN